MHTIESLLVLPNLFLYILSHESQKTLCFIKPSIHKVCSSSVCLKERKNETKNRNDSGKSKDRRAYNRF